MENHIEHSIKPETYYLFQRLDESRELHEAFCSYIVALLWDPMFAKTRAIGYGQVLIQIMYAVPIISG